jgi:hypothetical protein
MDFAQKRGVALGRFAPKDSQRRTLLEQQPIGGQLGDRTGREADRQQTAPPGKAAQTGDANRPADRVEDDIRSGSAGHSADGALPISRFVRDDRLGAELPADRQFLLRPRDGDGPASMRQSDLQRGAADSSGPGVHEHRLAGANLRTIMESVVGGRIVDPEQR